MKAIVVAIVTIALAGCAAYSHDDARKDDLTATPIATSARAGEDKIPDPLVRRNGPATAP